MEGRSRWSWSGNRFRKSPQKGEKHMGNSKKRKFLALIAVRFSVGVQRVRRREIDGRYTKLKNKSLFAHSRALETVMLSRDDVCTHRPVRYPRNGSRRDAEMGNSERRLVRVRFNSVVALAVCKNKKQIKFKKKNRWNEKRWDTVVVRHARA